MSLWEFGKCDLRSQIEEIRSKISQTPQTLDPKIFKQFLVTHGREIIKGEIKEAKNLL